MAAGEDQPQPIVADPALVLALVFNCAVHRSDLLQLLLADPRPAQPIEGAVAGGDPQPPARVLRDAVLRPALEGPCERVLGTLLGQVPVPGDTNEIGDNASPLFPERFADRLLRIAYTTQTGLTSTVPNSAAGFREANSSASSKSSH